MSSSQTEPANRTYFYPNALTFYEDIEGVDPLTKMVELEVPKLTDEILSLQIQKETAAVTSSDAIASVFATSISKDIEANQKDQEVIQKLKDLTNALSSLVTSTQQNPVSDFVASSLTSLVKSTIQLAGRLKAASNKEGAAAAIETAVRLTKIINREDITLEVIELLITHKVYDNDYLKSNLFENYNKDFKYMVFGQEGPLITLEKPEDADNSITTCHITSDQTRVLVEYNKTYAFYSKQPILKNGKPHLQLAYHYKQSSGQESFYYGGNLWVTQYSDVGPLQFRSKGYNRDWNFNYQKYDRLSPKTEGLLTQSNLGDMRKQFFCYLFTQYGVFMNVGFFKNSSDKTKKLITITLYEPQIEKYNYKKVEKEIGIHKDGKLHTKWPDDVKNSNAAYIGHNLFLHGKDRSYLLVHSATAEVLEEAHSPNIINGIDSTTSQVFRFDPAKGGIHYTPCDVFSNYDCMFSLSESSNKTTSSSNAPQTPASIMGFHEHDESYDESISDSGSTSGAENIKGKSNKVAEMEESKKEEVAKEQEPKVTSNILAPAKVDNLAKMFIGVSNQLFKKFFAESPTLPKAGIFKTIISILSQWENFKTSKHSVAISLSLFHILYCLLNQVSKYQDPRDSGIKILSQEVIISLLDKIAPIESDKSAGIRCMNVFKNLKLKITIILTSLIKKLTPDRLKHAWDQTLIERVSSPEKDILLWLSQTLRPKQDSQIYDTFLDLLAEKLQKGLELEGKAYQEFYTVNFDKLSPNFSSNKNIACNLKPCLYYIYSHPDILKRNAATSLAFFKKVLQGFEQASKSFGVIANSTRIGGNWRWEDRIEIEEVLSSSLFVWTYCFLHQCKQALPELFSEPTLNIFYKLMVAAVGPFKDDPHNSSKNYPDHQLKPGGCMLEVPKCDYLLSYQIANVFGKGMIHVVDEDGYVAEQLYSQFTMEKGEYIFLHTWEQDLRGDSNIKVQLDLNQPLRISKGFLGLATTSMKYYVEKFEQLKVELNELNSKLGFSHSLIEVNADLLKPAESKPQEQPDSQTPSTEAKKAEQEMETETKTLIITEKEKKSPQFTGPLQQKYEKYIEGLTEQDLKIVTNIIENLPKDCTYNHNVSLILSTSLVTIKSMLAAVRKYYDLIKEVIEACNGCQYLYDSIIKYIRVSTFTYGNMITGLPPITQSLHTYVLTKRSGNDLDNFIFNIELSFKMIGFCFANGWADDVQKLISLDKDTKEAGSVLAFYIDLIEEIIALEKRAPHLSTDNARILYSYFSKKLTSITKEISNTIPSSDVSLKDYLRYGIGNVGEDSFIAWAQEQVGLMHSKHFMQSKPEHLSLPKNADKFSEYVETTKIRNGKGFDPQSLVEDVQEVYRAISRQYEEETITFAKQRQAIEIIELVLDMIKLSKSRTFQPLLEKEMSLNMFVDLACSSVPAPVVILALKCVDLLATNLPLDKIEGPIGNLIANLGKNTTQFLLGSYSKTAPPLRSLLILPPFNLNCYTPSKTTPVHSSAQDFWTAVVCSKLQKSTSGLLLAWLLLRATLTSPSDLDLHALNLITTPTQPSRIPPLVLALSQWMDTTFTQAELGRGSEWKWPEISEACANSTVGGVYLEEYLLRNKGLRCLVPEIGEKVKAESEGQSGLENKRSEMKSKLYGIYRKQTSDARTTGKDNTEKDCNDEKENKFMSDKFSPSKTDIRVSLLQKLQTEEFIPPLEILVKVAIDSYIQFDKTLPTKGEIASRAEQPAAPNQVQASQLHSPSPTHSPKKPVGQTDIKSVIANSLIRGALLDVRKNVPESCRSVITFKKDDPCQKVDLSSFPRWIAISEHETLWFDADMSGEPSYIKVEEVQEEKKTEEPNALYSQIVGIKAEDVKTGEFKYKVIVTNESSSDWKSSIDTKPIVLVPCVPELSSSNQFYLSTYLSPIISKQLNKLIEGLYSGKLDIMSPVTKELSGANLQLAMALAEIGEELWKSKEYSEHHPKYRPPVDRPQISPKPIMDLLEANGLASLTMPHLQNIFDSLICSSSVHTTTKPRLSELILDTSAEYRERWSNLCVKLKEDIIEKAHLKAHPTIPDTYVPNPNVAINDLKTNGVAKIYLRKLGRLLALSVKGFNKLPISLTDGVWSYILGRGKVDFNLFREICPERALEIEALITSPTEEGAYKGKTLSFNKIQMTTLNTLIEVYTGSELVKLSESNINQYIHAICSLYFARIEQILNQIRQGFSDVMSPLDRLSETVETAKASTSTWSNLASEPTLDLNTSSKLKLGLASPLFQRSVRALLHPSKAATSPAPQPSKNIQIPPPVPEAPEGEEKRPEPPKEESEHISLGGLFD